MKPTYVVEIRRSGRWWAIDVPELRGVFSQARRLADVEPMARDAIAAVLDVSPRSFNVVLRPILGSRLESLVRDARERRIAAHETQIQAAERSAEALRSLQRSGFPLRDAGELLGISHQRAAQIAAADVRPVRANRRKAIAELRGSYDFG
ncbi:MAG: type II toxin-antitoxin system HicB family antitoxin [Candidatus Limnocylindria bacterium]